MFHPQSAITGPSSHARFWAKVDKSSANGCWRWTAATNSRGYGQFWLSPRHRMAHTVAYELLIGTVPAGLVLDHLCRNHSCVNPAHLEPVTQAENIARGMAPNALAVRTGRCMRGHELTPDNLRVNKRSGGRASKRQCRTCHNAITRACSARRRAAMRLVTQ